jgi:hypothetical protein
MAITHKKIDQGVNPNKVARELGATYMRKFFAGYNNKELFSVHYFNSQDVEVAMYHQCLDSMTLFDPPREWSVQIANAYGDKEFLFKRGQEYVWKHNKTPVLIYLGRNWSGNGYWHQFSKVEEPSTVWCEVLDADLHMLEEAP